MFMTRARARRKMDRLAASITRSMKKDPDAFDERERLWMKREDLREQYLEMMCRPSLFERLVTDLFGPRHLPTIGLGVATFIATGNFDWIGDLH